MDTFPCLTSYDHWAVIEARKGNLIAIAYLASLSGDKAEAVSYLIHVIEQVHLRLHSPCPDIVGTPYMVSA